MSSYASLHSSLLLISLVYQHFLPIKQSFLSNGFELHFSQQMSLLNMFYLQNQSNYNPYSFHTFQTSTKIFYPHQSFNLFVLNVHSYPSRSSGCYCDKALGKSLESLVPMIFCHLSSAWQYIASTFFATIESYIPGERYNHTLYHGFKLTDSSLPLKGLHSSKKLPTAPLTAGPDLFPSPN